VDLTRIDGIDVSTVRVVAGKLGADMNKRPDDRHFACWLGLCPATKVTGGKVTSGMTARVADLDVLKRAAQINCPEGASCLRPQFQTRGTDWRRGTEPIYAALA